MIPLFASLSFRQRSRIWIPVPLFLIWVLLLPIGLILLPFYFVACVVAEVNPWRLMTTSWRVLTALPGTLVEVGQGRHRIQIAIH